MSFKLKIVALFCILNCSSFFSQQTKSVLSTSIEFTPLLEKALIKIQSDTDSILNVSVQLIDHQKKIIKSQKLPNEYRFIKSYIDLLDLFPGKYTLVIFKDSIQLNTKEFIKDEILAEPQKQPVIRKEK